MTSTMDISTALQAGADDDTLDALIGSMLGDTSGHAVMTWRQDNYLDLRRWACPPLDDYLQAQTKITAGGALAAEGEALLATYYAARLAVDFRFPSNPYVPDAEVPEPPEPWSE